MVSLTAARISSTVTAPEFSTDRVRVSLPTLVPVVVHGACLKDLVVKPLRLIDRAPILLHKVAVWTLGLHLAASHPFGVSAKDFHLVIHGSQLVH